MIGVGQALSELVSKVVFWFLVGYVPFILSDQQNSNGFSIFSMVTVALIRISLIFCHNR